MTGPGTVARRRQLVTRGSDSQAATQAGLADAEYHDRVLPSPGRGLSDRARRLRRCAGQPLRSRWLRISAQAVLTPQLR